MKTIQIPYYKGTMDLHVSEQNLKAVITAKMHEFTRTKEKENSWRRRWRIPSERSG